MSPFKREAEVKKFELTEMRTKSCIEKEKYLLSDIGVKGMAKHHNVTKRKI